MFNIAPNVNRYAYSKKGERRERVREREREREGKREIYQNVKANQLCIPNIALCHLFMSFLILHLGQNYYFVIANFDDTFLESCFANNKKCIWRQTLQSNNDKIMGCKK